MNTKPFDDYRGGSAAIELVVVPVPGDRSEHAADRMSALQHYLRTTGRGGWTTSVEPGLDALPLNQRRSKLSNRNVDVVAVVRMADVSVPTDPGRLDVSRLGRLLVPLDRHQRAGVDVMARRTMLKTVGGFGLGLALAACGSKATTSSGATTTTASGATPSTTASATSALSLAPETTEGPYYLDLDLVRSDVREDRQGLPLVLDITVVDEQGRAIKGAAVDIWHCDAGGIYSGFAAQSTGAGGNPPSGPGRGGPGNTGGPGTGGPPPSGPGGGPGNAGGPGAGSYTAGNRTVSQGTATDTSKFLRGTQITDDSGKASFTTVYPGWYTGRTVHIHALVNVNNKTVHVGQLFFDDALSDKIYASTTPYNSHSNRDTRNSNDSIYQAAASGGLLDLQTAGSGYKSVVRMAVKAS